MMNLRVVVGAVLFGFAARVSGADPQSLSIVFIGDSITYGYLLTAPAEEAPPRQSCVISSRNALLFECPLCELRQERVQDRPVFAGEPGERLAAG